MNLKSIALALVLTSPLATFSRSALALSVPCASALDRSDWVVVLRDSLSREEAEACRERITALAPGSNYVNYLKTIQILLINASPAEAAQMKTLECVDTVSLNSW